jgi:ubiquinone/menaquinone biosynthesis C-methylase UbiE
MALEQLGFSNVVGVDLSEQLLQQYHGRFTCYIADCRNLPLGDSSQDFVLIQGGLHHLPTLPDDLHRTLREVHRVLAPDGRLAVVEPWRTAFLEIVHFGCRRSLARRLWPRLDALAVMIEHEERTYAQWLSRPREILDVVHQHFVPASLRIRWGKIALLAQKRYAGVDSDRGG